MKKCPFCAEQIQNEAIKCKYCDAVLINKEVPIEKRLLKNICPKCLHDYDPSWTKCINCGHPLGVEDRKSLGLTDPDEHIYVDVNPVIFSYGVWLLLGLILLLAFGLGAIVLVLVLIHRKSLRYMITNRQIVTEKGIFQKQKDMIDIQFIRSISAKQNMMGQALNYGNIYIGTSGTAGNEIVMTGIGKPHMIVALINKLQHN